MPTSSSKSKAKSSYSSGDVADQLQSMWNRAEKERKSFIAQVLPKELGGNRRTSVSPKVNLLADTITAKLGDLHKTVNNIKEGEAVSDLGLWTLDSDGMPLPEDGLMAGARSSPPSLSDSDSAASTVDASSKMNGRERERMRTLEAMVIAHQDEIRELRALLLERDTVVHKMQGKNGALTAKLEERDQLIAQMESKLSRLNSRLREQDAYGPPAWIVKEAVRGGYGLEAMGLMQSAPISSPGGGGAVTRWHDDDMWGGGSSLVPGYEDFCEKLSCPSAAPLLNMVESFIKAFVHKRPRGSDTAMVTNFLGAMENPFRSHSLWSNIEESDMEDTLDSLERHILGVESIATSILSNMGPDLGSMDKDLEKRMWCLQFVQPHHLDIKKAHSNHPALTLARKMLLRTNQVHAPQEKLECVFRCARIIFRMLNETAAVERKEAASADDFLPLLIYTVLRSGAKQLHSTVEYICTFRRASRLGGERHYYLVQLHTAVTFLHHIDSTSLTIAKSDFDSSLAAAELRWGAGGSQGWEAGGDDSGRVGALGKVGAGEEMCGGESEVKTMPDQELLSI